MLVGRRVYSCWKNRGPVRTALAVFITMVVGLGWMMEGVMALAESWRLPSSGWAVLYAIISIIAGLVVLVSPVSSMRVPGDFLRMCADRHGCFLDGPRVQVRPSEA